MRTISPPVLYYHSVAPELNHDWVLKFLTLDLKNFESQLQYLVDRRYKTIFLDEWVQIRQNKCSSQHNEVCLTFDDGLLDNWVYAYPMAKKYGIKMTIFVNPEYVDPEAEIRQNLEDVWNGKCSLQELDGRGYLSWAEMREMVSSGLVDIQNHTMSHAKYPVSSSVKQFYYGGFTGLHSILNQNPNIKPTYPRENQFERRLSPGTPIFEETSAVVARIHTPNRDVVKSITSLATKYDLENTVERSAFEKEARIIVQNAEKKNILIEKVETEKEYRSRLEYEVVGAKEIIEKELGKEVSILCWPHGDNSTEAHSLAKSSGHIATTSGKMLDTINDPDRIPRIGADFHTAPWINRQKLNYKIKSHFRRQPYHLVAQANQLKNQLLGKY